MSGFDTERFDHIAVSDWQSSTDRRTTMTAVKRPTPRQRYLLAAAFDGRVFVDGGRRYWLQVGDHFSAISAEFRAIVRRDWARDPIPIPADPDDVKRILWVAEDFQVAAEVPR